MLASTAAVDVEALRRSAGREVVLTTRDGRVRVGRLDLKGRCVELSQLVHGIPCRRTLRIDEISACYTTGWSDDSTADEITLP
ncbi:hypothetical protein [Haliangium sp.]|uniref:hypothetical protein n=1 Tax=Haliangium sp. TaxID=2663208 RepID=UPI003D13A4D8